MTTVTKTLQTTYTVSPADIEQLVAGKLGLSVEALRSANVRWVFPRYSNTSPYGPHYDLTASPSVVLDVTETVA